MYRSDKKSRIQDLKRVTKGTNYGVGKSVYRISWVQSELIKKSCIRNVLRIVLILIGDEQLPRYLHKLHINFEFPTHISLSSIAPEKKIGSREVRQKSETPTSQLSCSTSFKVVYHMGTETFYPSITSTLAHVIKAKKSIGAQKNTTEANRGA